VRFCYFIQLPTQARTGMSMKMSMGVCSGWGGFYGWLEPVTFAYALA